MKNKNQMFQTVGSLIASVSLAALIIVPALAAPGDKPGEGPVTPTFDSLDVTGGTNLADLNGKDATFDNVQVKQDINTVKLNVGTSVDASNASIVAKTIEASESLTGESLNIKGGDADINGILIDKDGEISGQGKTVKIADDKGLMIGDFGFYFEGDKSGKMYKLADKSGNDCAGWNGNIVTINEEEVCAKEITPGEGGGGGGGEGQKIIAPWTLEDDNFNSIFKFDENGEISSPFSGITKIISPLEAKEGITIGNLNISKNGLINGGLSGSINIFNTQFNQNADGILLVNRGSGQQSFQSRLNLKNDSIDLNLGNYVNGQEFNTGSGLRMNGDSLNIQGGYGAPGVNPANLNLSFDQNKNSGIFTFTGSLMGTTKSGLMVDDALSINGPISNQFTNDPVKIGGFPGGTAFSIGGWIPMNNQFFESLRIASNGDISNVEGNKPVNFTDDVSVAQNLDVKGDLDVTGTLATTGINGQIKTNKITSIDNKDITIEAPSLVIDGELITKTGIDGIGVKATGHVAFMTGENPVIGFYSSSAKEKGIEVFTGGGASDNFIAGSFTNKGATAFAKLATPDYAIQAQGKVYVNGHLQVSGGIGSFSTYELAKAILPGQNGQIANGCFSVAEIPVSCGYKSGNADILDSYLDSNQKKCIVNAKNNSAQNTNVKSYITCWNPNGL